MWRLKSKRRVRLYRTWSSKAGGDMRLALTTCCLPANQPRCLLIICNSFGKWVEFQQVNKQGFASIKQTIMTYADVEGLPTHKLSALSGTIKEDYE